MQPAVVTSPSEPAAPHLACAPGRFLVRFLVRNDHQVRVVRAADVTWLAAAGNYVILHVSGETHILRESLVRLEARLDPACFVRISRSALVNLDHIRAIAPDSSGEPAAVLADGTRLPITRSVRELYARLECG